MTYRVEVCDKSGNPLAELDRLTGCRWSYALNKSSSAVIDINIKHPKAKAEYLAQHNLIKITHDELEVWAGYISDPQWPSDGDVITLNCTSIHQKLGQRRSDVIKYEQKRAFDIFSALIIQANATEHTGIYVGSISAGDIPLDFELRRDNIYDKMQELLEKAKLEWHLTFIDMHTFTAELVNRVGKDKTASIFIQGGYDTNGLPDYTEEMSNFANRIVGVGKLPEGTEIPEGEDDYKYRPTYIYTDEISMRKYGLVEDVVEFDTEDPATLQRLTIEECQKRSYPKVTLSLAVNRRRGLWGDFTEGDIIAVQLPNYGYDGLIVPIRILGREIDDGNGVMTVACEVIQGNEATALDMYKYAHYATEVQTDGKSDNPTESYGNDLMSRALNAFNTRGWQKAGEIPTITANVTGIAPVSSVLRVTISGVDANDFSVHQRVVFSGISSPYDQLNGAKVVVSAIIDSTHFEIKAFGSSYPVSGPLNINLSGSFTGGGTVSTVPLSFAESDIMYDSGTYYLFNTNGNGNAETSLFYDIASWTTSDGSNKVVVTTTTPHHMLPGTNFTINITGTGGNLDGAELTLASDRTATTFSVTEAGVTAGGPAGQVEVTFGSNIHVGMRTSTDWRTLASAKGTNYAPRASSPWLVGEGLYYPTVRNISGTWHIWGTVPGSVSNHPYRQSSATTPPTWGTVTGTAISPMSPDAGDLSVRKDPNSSYYYMVGNSDGASALYLYKTLTPATDSSWATVGSGIWTGTTPKPYWGFTHQPDPNLVFKNNKAYMMFTGRNFYDFGGPNQMMLAEGMGMVEIDLTTGTAIGDVLELTNYPHYAHWWDGTASDMNLVNCHDGVDRIFSFNGITLNYLELQP